MDTKGIEALKQKVQKLIQQYSYTSAQFLADKLVTLDACEEHVYLLAQCFYASKQYKRAHRILHPLHSLKSKHLAAKCMEELQQWEQVLETLGDEESFYEKVNSAYQDATLCANLCLLRGKAYDMLENQARASLSYRNALKFDPACYEAYFRLTQDDGLLNKAEQANMVEKELKFEWEWLKTMYLVIQQRESPVVLESIGFDKTVDVLQSQAASHFNLHNFQKVYEITKAMVQKDPFQYECLPLYISSMAHLRLKNELFICAHELVEAHSALAISWYAVGCYYICTGKHDQARKYFSKSVLLDKRFLPAYMGIAHSFAASNDSEPAISAYRTVYRQFPGCWLAPLYIAMESIKTNQISVADMFLQKAKELAPPNEPMVLNELACLYYKQKDYAKALQYFLQVRSLIDVKNAEWEPVITNLGHTFRKMHMYKQAIECFEQALTMSSNHASIYASIGFAYHAQNDLHKAIEHYHRALALEDSKNQDNFVAILLDKAIKQLSSQGIGDLVQAKNMF